jgi:RNA-directed DNA polymerase
MMHDQEKSDLSILAVKPANKGGQPSAESMERREGAEAKMIVQHGNEWRG